METHNGVGRGMVLAVIAGTLTVSILVIVAFNIIQGPERLPQQIIRLLLTFGLCVFLYRGANWARWIAGILFAWGGVGSLLAGALMLSSNMYGIVLFAMGLVYVGSAIILLFLPAVRTYFGVGRARARQ